MSILQWTTSIQLAQESASELLQNPQNANSELFTAYLVLSLLLKRSSYAMAFFVSCMLFELKIFDILTSCSLYLLTFVIYSYVFTCCENNKSKVACAIILFLSIILAVESALYGAYGYYEAVETFIYNNIEHLSLYAHIVFICSLTPIRRIKNSIRDITYTVLHMSRNSAYFVLC